MINDNILSDSKNFVKSFHSEKDISFIIGIEKKIPNLPKELKESEAISEIAYKKLKPRRSGFSVLYGLCKTHRKVVDKCPPFRLILSPIKTPA